MRRRPLPHFAPCAPRLQHQSRSNTPMSLHITHNGIVQRHDNGRVVLLRPGKIGGTVTEIEVSEELADTYRLATGDVVEGATEPIEEAAPQTARSDEVMEDEAGWHEQYDEPAAAAHKS